MTDTQVVMSALYECGMLIMLALEKLRVAEKNA
jgi:hypothetical protein